MPTKPNDPLATIPEPRVVRERLGANLRETRILRRLLRLSESMAKDRRKEGSTNS